MAGHPRRSYSIPHRGDKEAEIKLGRAFQIRLSACTIWPLSAISLTALGPFLYRYPGCSVRGIAVVLRHAIPPNRFRSILIDSLSKLVREAELELRRGTSRVRLLGHPVRSIRDDFTIDDGDNDWAVRNPGARRESNAINRVPCAYLSFLWGLPKQGVPVLFLLRARTHPGPPLFTEDLDQRPRQLQPESPAPSAAFPHQFAIGFRQGVNARVLPGRKRITTRSLRP